MRITSKIMQNNALTNLNNNKILQDKLNTQISTEKKITRPSDDPVVAIRALRLRTNVSEVTQYYEKNVPDAKSWLSVTEEALDTVSDVVTDMQKQYTKGSNGDLTTTDRKTILEQLKALRDEVYATGDADYAGRTVFTGYRTDTKLSFSADETLDYRIAEKKDANSLETISYTDTGSLDTLNTANQATTAIDPTTITTTDVHRIRLAYDTLNSSSAPTITYTDSSGTPVTVAASVVSKYAVADPYTTVPATGAYLIPETGEVILGDTLYNTLAGLTDNNATTTVDESQFKITYDKSAWSDGDLRPENYFACTSDPGGTNEIVYNGGYATGTFTNQTISYDVGYNQSLQVNTSADECFNQDIGRDVDEMVNTIGDVGTWSDLVAQLTKALDGMDKTNANYATLTGNLEAANKALTQATDKMQSMFESGITKMQSYLDRTNLAITNCGTRSSRLELVESRLSAQQTNFETLQSQNEDADVTQLAVSLSSAELSYQAALLATGKIAKTTLLDYI